MHYWYDLTYAHKSGFKSLALKNDVDIIMEALFTQQITYQKQHNNNLCTMNHLWGNEPHGISSQLSLRPFALP